MAGRRTGGGRSRMDLRREADALEAREKEPTDTEEVEDEEEEDEDEEDEAEEGDADADADAGGDEDADDDEDAPKKKKKPKAKPKAKAPAKKRTRAVKEVRMKAVWKVFDNAGKVVGTFPYPQRKEADELLAAKIEEKKTTFYIQLVKEPLGE